jgi:hypothetical protein
MAVLGVRRALVQLDKVFRVHKRRAVCAQELAHDALEVIQETLRDYRLLTTSSGAMKCTLN